MTIATPWSNGEAPSRAGFALAPIIAAIFFAYLVIGIAMPVLPLHVQHGLGLGTVVVGLVAGSQFAASLLSRMWAGHQADTRGAKGAVVIGLATAAASGLLYLLSAAFVASPVVSAGILLLGRALLGGAESFIVMGALGWGLALAGSQNAGKVMAWVGTAMYAAFAAGAPLGTMLYARFGFAAIGLATVFIPLVTLALVWPLRGVAPGAPARASFTTVLRAIWVPGLGLALSSVGFGAITIFAVLLFAQKRWDDAWIALTAVSVAFIIGRLALGHLPDKIGGARVALISVVVEAAGLLLIWRAPSALAVFAGAAVAGFGYALVYPALGVEARTGRKPRACDGRFYGVPGFGARGCQPRARFCREHRRLKRRVSCGRVDGVVRRRRRRMSFVSAAGRAAGHLKRRTLQCQINRKKQINPPADARRSAMSRRRLPVIPTMFCSATFGSGRAFRRATEA